MLFQTPTQFAVLLLLLVVGWLFGLASHPRGRKWRRAYDEERLNYAGYRDDAENQLKDADRRIAELERENARLRTDLDKVRPVVAASEAVPAGTVASAQPAPKRGWFSWPSGGDDFGKIRGLDTVTARRLKAEGVTRYAELASLTDTDEIALERRLNLPAGFIQREQWRQQAALLAEARGEEHSGKFS